MDDGAGSPGSAGSDRGGQLVWCICGEIILSFVGEGFVVTLESKERWMRRRNDAFRCPHCERRHDFSDLKALAMAGPESQAAGG